MIGLVQKIFFDMVESKGGAAAVIAVKERANIPLDTIFQINKVYDDEQWKRTFFTTLDVLQVSPEQICDLFAEQFTKDLQLRFPVWFSISQNSYEFLAILPTLYNCITTGVSEQKERANTIDRFWVEKFDNKIITYYQSDNKQCGIYKAVAKHIINHYKDEAVLTEIDCMHNGADKCQINIEWIRING